MGASSREAFRQQVAAALAAGVTMTTDTMKGVLPGLSEEDFVSVLLDVLNQFPGVRDQWLRHFLVWYYQQYWQAFNTDPHG